MDKRQHHGLKQTAYNTGFKDVDIILKNFVLFFILNP